MQTADGTDSGRFRDEAPGTALATLRRGACLVAGAPTVAKVTQQKFRPPISTRSHERREVAGTPEAALQLIDGERGRLSL